MRLIILTVSFLLISPASLAEVFWLEGEVTTLTLRNNNAYPENRPGFMELNDTAAAGACATVSGVVRIALGEGGGYFSESKTLKLVPSRIHDMLLRAAVENLTLVVNVDDSAVDRNGYCILKNVRFEFPERLPPLAKDAKFVRD